MSPIRLPPPAIRAATPRAARLPLPALRPGVAALAQRVARFPATAPKPARARVDYSGIQARPNPYVDYVRRYSAAGGIVITFKDIDESLWVTIRRVLMWLAAMAAATLYAVYLSPMEPVPNGIALVAMGIISALIVGSPVELYRTIEIRPDCMIIEGADVFWRDNMELGFPRFQKNAEGNSVLCGVYGTRWVEYFTVRRFDENDRAPEVFAAHLQAAMNQQWSGLGRNSG